MSYVNFDNIDACKFDQIATHLVPCAKIHDLLFLLHGKRGQDFCTVFYSNLHITAHFFGKRNQNMKRDFTWSITSPSVAITGLRNTSLIEVEVKGHFKIKITVMPISKKLKKDSCVHNYGIT
ncbi:hypothetical protein CFP56_009677 [Quercus suber]|uniref:Uncharacterized protein n=1 Tax=Quercus suber TaxID=58331 RepID=A0AAW0L199_QUESU